MNILGQDFRKLELYRQTDTRDWKRYHATFIKMYWLHDSDDIIAKMLYLHVT